MIQALVKRQLRRPQNGPNPAGRELCPCTHSLRARGSPLGDNRFYKPLSVQTYVAIAGDVTRLLQPPEVVPAFVVRLQVRVVQAVVLCPEEAAVGISQVKMA